MQQPPNFCLNILVCLVPETSFLGSGALSKGAGAAQKIHRHVIMLESESENLLNHTPGLGKVHAHLIDGIVSVARLVLAKVTLITWVGFRISRGYLTLRLGQRIVLSKLGGGCQGWVPGFVAAAAVANAALTGPRREDDNGVESVQIASNQTLPQMVYLNGSEAPARGCAVESIWYVFVFRVCF